jgi:hypothetical protein
MRASYGVVLGLFAALSCRPHGPHAEANGNSAMSGDSSHSAVRPGLYFAVSSDSVAWLAFLDPQQGAGSVYTPLYRLAVCRMEMDSVHGLSFVSAVENGQTLRFSGRGGGLDPLSGVLERTGQPGGRVLEKYDVAFEWVSDGKPNSYSGLFGNLHAGSEDLYGDELFLVHGSARSVALEVHYEGSPGKPRARRIRMVGDDIEVWWSGGQPDTGRVAGDTIRFTSGRRLVRTYSVSEVFSGDFPVSAMCP